MADALALVIIVVLVALLVRRRPRRRCAPAETVAPADRRILRTGGIMPAGAA